MPTRVAVLAQDLIWQDRLARAVEAAGAEPARAKTAPELDRALACADYAIVDLTARAYDPMAAIERAVQHGAHVLAVGQHDDVDERKRALRNFLHLLLAKFRPTREPKCVEDQRTRADSAQHHHSAERIRVATHRERDSRRHQQPE